ncbi:MAG: pseudouridine synthase [Oscillospiraceae bacterium]
MAYIERIQKIIASAGVCSRRSAEDMIARGKVTVNGRKCSLGDKANPIKDIIAIDGERIYVEKTKSLYYIMLNKPRGYVTTMDDEKGRKSVSELVKDVPARVYPVGRLDMQSEGLLLMTNDGDFANKMTHPKYHVNKTYRVTVRPDVTDMQAVALSSGVMIDGKKTSPATVHIVSKEEGRVVMEITIREGRNRQIRKMCEAVGLETARLKRISQGPIKLGMLQPGKWRFLKPSELIALRNSIKINDNKK